MTVLWLVLLFNILFFSGNSYSDNQPELIQLVEGRESDVGEYQAGNIGGSSEEKIVGSFRETKRFELLEGGRVLSDIVYSIDSKVVYTSIQLDRIFEGNIYQHKLSGGCDLYRFRDFIEVEETNSIYRVYSFKSPITNMWSIELKVCPDNVLYIKSSRYVN